MVRSGRNRTGWWGWARSVVPALVLAPVLVLVASACSSSARSGSTTTSTEAATASTGPAPLSAPSAQALAAVAARPGHLAIVDADGLGVTAPDGTGLRRVDPAGIGAEPTWAHAGQRLAWTRSTADGSEIVTLDLASGQRSTTSLAGPAPFYLQWSPDDAALAYLHTDPAGSGGVELGVTRPGSPPARIGVGEPMYVSWAPARAVMAAHVSQRQVLTVPSPLAPAPAPAGGPAGSGAPGGAPVPAPAAAVIQPTGPFGPPAWIDDTTVLAATEQALVTANTATGQQATVVRLGGAVQFVLSPDRKRVAYRQEGQSSAASPASYRVGPSITTTTTTTGAPGGGGGGGGGGLRVIELGTGEITEVSPISPLAFEWSPDSHHLAFLEPVGTDQRPRVRWSFWDGRSTSSSVAYQPSPAVTDGHLPFFDQFAQSTTGWSPDSAAFAYAGRPDGAAGGDAVWVQLVGRPGAPPVRVARGQLVTWGP